MGKTMKKPLKYLIELIPHKSLRKRLKNKYINEYKIEGNNNQIILFSDDNEEKFNYLPTLSITIKGNNNRIRIHKTAKISGQIYIEADNVEINFAEASYCNMILICDQGSNQRFILGKHSTIGFVDCRLNEDRAAVVIGENCMFSSRIDILGTDGHAIIDKKTHRILNKLNKPIIIGNNCWVGMGVTITKNANLPDNTIVGTGSIVTKQFTEKNTIIAGNPAKVIKRNIIWDRRNSSTLLEIEHGK